MTLFTDKTNLGDLIFFFFSFYLFIQTPCKHLRSGKDAALLMGKASATLIAPIINNDDFALSFHVLMLPAY